MNGFTLALGLAFRTYLLSGCGKYTLITIFCSATINIVLTICICTNSHYNSKIFRQINVLLDNSMLIFMHSIHWQFCELYELCKEIVNLINLQIITIQHIQTL